MLMQYMIAGTALVAVIVWVEDRALRHAILVTRVQHRFSQGQDAAPWVELVACYTACLGAAILWPMTLIWYAQSLARELGSNKRSR